MYAGVEFGGTKVVCLVGSGPDEVAATRRIPTTTPGETLDAVAGFLADHTGVDGVGIASFGPVELRPDHPAFGTITTTPKPHWSGADVLGAVRSIFDGPVGFETDVNGAALGEWRWGAGRGVRSLVYLTVGTGLGGGALVDGAPVHGLVHPEMGHIPVPRHPDDTYPGRCPFHGDCWEGMAAGPAIEQRWGRPGRDLGELTEEAVALEAHYLAAGIRSIVYVLAPERVIVGGGVSELPGLFPVLRSRLADQLSGYPGLAEHDSNGFVVPAALGGMAGPLGSLVVAERAAG
ncbi:MAG: ROK family protein [Acidimicrobiia bacterium]